MESSLIIHLMNMVKEYLTGNWTEEEALNLREEMKQMLQANEIYEKLGWRNECIAILEKAEDSSCDHEKEKEALKQWYLKASRQVYEEVISFTELLYAFEMGYKDAQVLFEIFDIPEDSMEECMEYYGFGD